MLPRREAYTMQKASSSHPERAGGNTYIVCKYGPRMLRCRWWLRSIVRPSDVSVGVLASCNTRWPTWNAFKDTRAEAISTCWSACRVFKVSMLALIAVYWSLHPLGESIGDIEVLCMSRSCQQLLRTLSQAYPTNAPKTWRSIEEGGNLPTYLKHAQTKTHWHTFHILWSAYFNLRLRIFTYGVVSQTAPRHQFFFQLPPTRFLCRAIVRLVWLVCLRFWSFEICMGEAESIEDTQSNIKYKTVQTWALEVALRRGLPSASMMVAKHHR